MTKVLRQSNQPRKAMPIASRVLMEYGFWLTKNYKKTGTYLTNARTFLKTIKQGGTVVSQLEYYSEEKSFTIQSFLRRFRRFLLEKEIDFVINDLTERKLPKSNPYVLIFLHQMRDRLQGDLSPSTYATILNHYFNKIHNNVKFFNKATAERFILSGSLSDFTKRLYKSVLKAFCEWAIEYRELPNKDLDEQQRQVKKGLVMISPRSLREIAAIKVRSSRGQLRSYHKDSLTERERNKLLKTCSNQRDRVIVALMAWSGLRTVEIVRLNVSDCLIKENQIAIWSKGKSSRSKDYIKLFATPKRELILYLKQVRIANGRLFPGLSKQDVSSMVKEGFKDLKLIKANRRYTPHSLRHTAGQLMYDKGVPLEFIQRTLRHAAMETTLVYAQKAIDRNYFKKMPVNI